MKTRFDRISAWILSLRPDRPLYQSDAIELRCDACDNRIGGVILNGRLNGATILCRRCLPILEPQRPKRAEVQGQ